MIAFASNNSIGTHKSLSRCSINGSGNQKSFVVPAKPVFTSPAVIKIIMTFPTIYITKFFNIFPLLTNNYMSAFFSRKDNTFSWNVVGLSYGMSTTYNFLKQWFVNI